MVVFSCDMCGDLLKKNQVDAHVARCRCDSISCVDCSVSFFGDDFRAHTSCITEAERYEKSVYRGGNRTQKRNPQQGWMELIATASLSAPSTIQRHVEMLASLDNVPRKPKQFRNFTANSLNLRGRQATDIVDAMWNHLSQLHDKEQEARKREEEEQKLLQETSKKAQSEISETREACKALKSSAIADEKISNSKCEKGSNVSPKTMKRAMKKVLKKAPGRSMKLKDLRRAVRGYLAYGDSSQPKISKKMLIRELVGNDSKFMVEGKVVILR